MKIKMRGKIIALTLVPVLVLGVAIMQLSRGQISNVIQDDMENTLRAAAISVRNTLMCCGEGKFALNAEGELVKGDFNITQSEQLADAICSETGVEVTVFYGDTRYMTSLKNDAGERLIGTKAADVVIEKVLKGGEAYFDENVDVAGTPFFAYFIPYYGEDGAAPVGMVFAGISQEHAEKDVKAITNTLSLIIFVVVLLTIGGAAITATNMMKSLHRSISALEELAEGNLTVKIPEKYINRRDEIGMVGKAVNKLKEQLTIIVRDIGKQSVMMDELAIKLKTRTGEMAESITQVERAVEDVAEGAGNQAEETQRANENVMTIGDMIGGNMQDTEALNQNAANMQTAGEAVMTTFEVLNQTNQKAIQSIQTIYEQTNTTNASAQKIQEATNLITSIAEETNLLALNASIEAARAGEHGRGFAVVAAQIQKLAEQCNASAGQITEIVDSLLADSAEAVETMQYVQDIVQTQDKDMKETHVKLEEVLKGIADSFAMVNKVTEQTEQMDEARANVIDIVQSLSAISQENAASSEETLASITVVNDVMQELSKQSAELKVIADEINRKLEVFQL